MEVAVAVLVAVAVTAWVGVAEAVDVAGVDVDAVAVGAPAVIAAVADAAAIAEAVAVRVTVGLAVADGHAVATMLVAVGPAVDPVGLAVAVAGTGTSWPDRDPRNNTGMKSVVGGVSAVVVATLKTIESATAAWIEYRFLIIVYENTFIEWSGCDHAHGPRPGSGSQRHPCKKPATFRRPSRSPRAIRAAGSW